jgi:arsenite methyltransferase
MRRLDNRGMTSRDCWADWLLRRRFGGDRAVEQAMLERLRGTRDRVLDGAGVLQGQTVLDVGFGDGLIAFGALDRGARLVIFSDISPDLLGEARGAADEAGVSSRCRFVQAPAEGLSPIGDQSVDVVTTRSVLIYVDRKARAFSEFHRVLRPAGRLSLFEPVNRLNRFLRAYDAGGVRELDDRVNGVFEALQPRDRDPMLNFDDRDLMDLAESAGFPRVSLTLEVELQPPEPMPWDAYVNLAPNPKVPALREVIEQVLTPKGSSDTNPICGPWSKPGAAAAEWPAPICAPPRIPAADVPADSFSNAGHQTPGHPTQLTPFSAHVRGLSCRSR